MARAGGEGAAVRALCLWTLALAGHGPEKKRKKTEPKARKGKPKTGRGKMKKQGQSNEKDVVNAISASFSNSGPTRL